MMAQQSPPKPWERQGSSAISTALASTPGVTPAPGNTTTTVFPSSDSSSLEPPAIPDRPSALSSVVNRAASSYSTPAASFGARPYGSSPYGLGGGLGGSMYSSPYSRFGGGSMYGGGMYGSGLYGGGMGGGYGSMYGGGMYGGGMGMPGDPNDPNNTLTNNFQQSTQATFQIIESIVGAFGGFAQMLESTYMATHSSFFAMVSVAEQFGNLRTTLGSVLGIFAILRWLRTLFAKVTGRPPPADATSLTPSAFAAFTGSAIPTPNIPPGQPGHVPPRPSKKPFIMFIVAVFGLPYLMGKLIRALAKSHEEAAAAQQAQQQQLGPNGQPLLPGGYGTDGRGGLDPSKLDFCRVLWDFPPQEALASGNYSSAIDLPVKKGDLVAVLDKSNMDGSGQGDSDWWRCRARDGRLGYLPAVYLETIQRPKPQSQITSGPGQGQGQSQSAPGSRAQTMSAASAGSRAQTMLSSNAGEGRAQTMSSATSLGSARSADAAGKAAQDSWSAESFQKSGFYNP